MEIAEYLYAVGEDSAAEPHSLETVAKKVLTVMEVIGKDCLKGLAFLQTYLPEATALASILFPAAGADLATATNIINLIENAVVTIEAKWATANASTGTGTQKLADVLSLVQGTVTQLLSQMGVEADSGYVTKLVNVVVDILNVVSAPASSATATSTTTTTATA